MTVPGPTKRIARLRGIFMPRPEISATRLGEREGGEEKEIAIAGRLPVSVGRKGRK